jgi:hypothetical protein
MKKGKPKCGFRAGKFDLSARLSNRLTVAVNSRLQRDELNGKLSPSVALQ